MKPCEQTFWELVSKQMCPSHLIRLKTHVLIRFARFRQCENGRHELGSDRAPDKQYYANEVSRYFIETNMPNPPY